jgi:hypothetical protein
MRGAGNQEELFIAIIFFNARFRFIVYLSQRIDFYPRIRTIIVNSKKKSGLAEKQRYSCRDNIILLVYISNKYPEYKNRSDKITGLSFNL